MKANTAIGIGAGLVCVLLSVILEGGNPMALFEIPALMVIRLPLNSQWISLGPNSKRKNVAARRLS